MMKFGGEDCMTAEDFLPESQTGIISGGISGAITDPYSDAAEKHAELYYNEIRSFTTDIERIAQNTGYSYDQIALIKNYLFQMEHTLESGRKRFDPCFEIAESWRRLAFDPQNIKSHDLTLLRHEIKEMEILNAVKGISQSDAHTLASKEFNYQEESKEYYKSLGYDAKDNSTVNKDGGGIKRQQKTNWEERY